MKNFMCLLVVKVESRVRNVGIGNKSSRLLECLDIVVQNVMVQNWYSMKN